MKKSIILIFTCLFFSCGSTKMTTQTLKYDPKFGYTPEKRTQISSSSLTIAIIDPVFSDGKTNQLVDPYLGFVNNMADDFEETLNANGFKIKGPYKSRDEMVYGDKLNSDFAIEIEVEILTENEDFGKKQLPLGRALLCKSCFRLAGTFYHKGRIIITATDPIDGEKFWKKTVDLDRKIVVTDGNLEFNPGKLTDEAILRDTGIYNPVAKVLESYYAEAMTSLSRQIDPREMQQIAKQIKEKRSRVGQ